MKRELEGFEIAQAVTNDHYPFNVVASLHLTNGPTEETLKNVFIVMQKRHPALRVSLKKEKTRHVFVMDTAPEIPIKIYHDRDPDRWHKIVEEELHTYVDYLNGPLLRLTYLPAANNGKEKVIIFTFHHSIIDAVSLTNLIHEMLLLFQNPNTFSIKGEVIEETFLPPAQNFFPIAHRGVKGRLNLLRFIFRQMADEFNYRLRSRTNRKDKVHLSSRGKILPLRLTKKQSSLIVKLSRKKRVTVNSLLNAAMLMALQKHIYNGEPTSLRYMSFADLRPYLKPPIPNYNLGSFVSMMRFTINLPSNTNIWELAEGIKNQTYSLLKKGEKFAAYRMSPFMMKATMRFKAFRMANIALSYSGPVPLNKQYGNISLKEIHAFVSNFGVGPEYTALARLFHKQIYFDILYLDTDMDQRMATTIATEITRQLDLAIEEKNNG